MCNGELAGGQGHAHMGAGGVKQHQAAGRERQPAGRVAAPGTPYTPNQDRETSTNGDVRVVKLFLIAARVR